MPWDVAKPAGTESVSRVDDIIRADKQTLLEALGSEHTFSSSSTTGAHKEGSARVWRGTAAGKAGKSMSEGRVYLETDTQIMRVGTNSAWEQYCPKRRLARLSVIPETEITHSTTSWADIATLDSCSITILAGGELMITATVTVKPLTSGKAVYLCLGVDGKNVTTAALGQLIVPYTGGPTSITLSRLVVSADSTETGITLSAGAHTVSMRWKCETGGTVELTQGINQTIQAEEV